MNRKQFLAAMYLRLSRDDSDVGDVTDREGNLKSESNSIGNQRELIRAFIHEQQDIELYDIYVDDGFAEIIWRQAITLRKSFPFWACVLLP